MGPSTGKTLLKSVTASIRQGRAVEACQQIQSWTNGSDSPLPDWDLNVGAAFWNRCVDKDLPSTDEETEALEKIYVSLIHAFIQNSTDTQQYMERIKVFAATLKYFVLKKRLNLESIEMLLQEISKSSFYVRQNEYASFKTVCMNFYALIWNYMRENHTQVGLLDSLAHVSLSIRWLVVLGLEQFQNVSHKLSQISFLLARSQVHTNAMIADFFYNLSTKIVDLMKHVILDDSNNGLKVKKKKSVLPVSHFHGILNITFVLSRQLVVYGDYEKASKVFRPITSVAQVYFENDLRQLWKSVLDAFVKICLVLTCGNNGDSDVKSKDDLFKCSDAFRECRKKILEISFQKAYPGYAFSFMYAFTESIGFVVTSSKNSNNSVLASSLLKHVPISKCTKFIKEMQFAADACVALDDMESGKHALEGITPNRKAEVYSTALFHVLKIASDKVCDKEVTIEKDFQQITEAAFSTLMKTANRKDLEKPKSAEIFNLIIFHTCNIGYAYQKRKNFKEATAWCYRATDSFESFKSTNVKTDLRINVLSIGILLADCYRQLENYGEGLRWLSKWLQLAPQILSPQSTAYDLYEQIPWTDWSVHWLAIQKEVCAADPDNCLSVVQYLEEENVDSVEKSFASKALRMEMNSYFAGRQTVVPALFNVGEQLVERDCSTRDVVLGLVSQAVSMWWVATEDSLNFATQLLNEALVLVEESVSLKDKDKPLRCYLSAVVMAWKALCTMKIYQIQSEKELERQKDRAIQENPAKLKDRVDGLYAMPGFTSLNIEDESKYAVNFIGAAECFYQLSQMEDIVKCVLDSNCPALAQITVRLVAMGLSALGEKTNAAKAWYATFVIAKVYDRKGLIVLSASEVLKIIPSTNLECVKFADMVNAKAQEDNMIKHNKAVYYRLDLAKALACYQQKNYKEGLLYLAEVYKFLAEKDNFDSTHHLMTEADYILSLYRAVSLSTDIEFPAGIPEMLCKMTPSGLAVKSFKLLGGLTRETDILPSGWTDLLHNYYLLGTIALVSVRTVKLLKETGKLRELKCFLQDTVYFYQRLGIVSRSVAMLIPLIEIDISARHFYLAQIRIAALSKVLLASNPQPAPTSTSASKFLENNLKIPGLSINRLENVANLKWQLGNIEATSFHYKNRSAKYLATLKVDCETIDMKDMKAPPFLRHPLTCFCYTCSHPEIIPSVLEFLIAQCKYAVAMKWKVSMAILELTRLHHQRAMFRILVNMEHIAEQLDAIVPRKTAAQYLHIVYSLFFFKPGMLMQLANMEISPIIDIKHIVHLMKSALNATDILDTEDLTLKALPLEIGTCALYEHLVSSKRLPIEVGNIRELIEARVQQQEKENTILVHSSPEVFEMTIPPAAPPVIRKRGANNPLTQQQLHGRKATVTSLRPRRILNSKAQPHPEMSATVELVDLTKVDNEERCIPIIPPPNFDDSNGD